MARLHINKVGIVNEFTNLFIKNLSVAMDALEKDILANTSSTIPVLTEGLKPEIFVKLIKREANKVGIDIKSNIAFILDNYGTGSLMSMNNPGLAKYKSSSLWNHLRTSNAIVGREAGTYENITGTHTTSGRFAGKNLEGKSVKLLKSGKTLRFKPIAPTNALHYAISWFYQDWFPSMWKATIREFNISKYLTFK